MDLNDLKLRVRSIPDWPQKGVIFRDITPVLENKKLFHFLINKLAEFCEGEKIDKIVGVDARGFIIASALAYKLKTGLAIVRKKGKLPWRTERKKYTLEYASETLEMHQDAIRPGERVLLCDDLLATGGTMRATADIVKKLGGKIIDILFFIELENLKGRKKLKEYKVKSLIKF